jgi:hypothetical protein
MRGYLLTTTAAVALLSAMPALAQDATWRFNPLTAIFGMNCGWHKHRNAIGGCGIRIRSQAFARNRRCAGFSVIRRRA